MPRFPNVEPLVFWPPFLALLAATALSGVDGEAFLAAVTGLNTWILDHFSWLFAGGTLFMVLTVAAVYASPLARVRIGGPEATPLLSPTRWFAVTLCTTVAVGILFWGPAEPLYHLHQPPESLGIAPNSEASARFAMSTMFMHWTLTPYAIYTVPALAFALAHYNHGEPYSLSSPLTLLAGERAHGGVGKLVDAVCLFALVAGMAASLGTGILTLSSGLGEVSSLDGGSTPLRLAITAAVVGTFVVSSVTGLLRGIRVLSTLNIRFFLVLAGYVLVVGPTSSLLSAGVEGVGEFALSFFPRSLMTGDLSGDPWPKAWTIFYWANWLAWAPVTAVFLGRVAVGYTVRQLIHVNLAATATFSGLWVCIFSGTSLYFDQQTGGALFATLQAEGPEAMVYAMFGHLPGAGLLTAAFLAVTFLSFVTAADSNTDAMSLLSLRGQSLDDEASSVGLKVIWGATVGAVALIMISYAGIDGVKALSVFGGFPALFLILLIALGLWRAALASRRA
ncbi:MAG: BCCT family transporter [Alphaproteobacteria bacterium]|nr:BCCT family transporter [Alphaproteobacteria bacterium]